MNIVLSDVEEKCTTIDENQPEKGLIERQRRMPMLFVRGDGVILVSPLN